MTALLLTALMVLAGCGQNDTDKAKKFAPLVLKEQASSVVKASGGYVVNWAAVIANSNPWHFGENTVAMITAHDAAGKEVVRMEQPLDAVPPAGSLAFTGEALAAAKPTAVKIDYRPAAWHQAARIPSAFKPFPVTKVVTEKLGNGSYLITGYVTDPFQKPASSLVVTALLRDAAGKLIGGGTAFVDDVQAGANRRFIITVESVTEGAEAVKTDVVARTWGATAKPYEDLALGGATPLHTVKPQTPPFLKDRGIQAITEKRS